MAEADCQAHALVFSSDGLSGIVDFRVLHHRAARNLDGCGENRRGFERLSAQPVHQLGQAMAVGFDLPLLDDPARPIHQTNPVLLRSPIDADKMLKIVLQGTQPPPPISRPAVPNITSNYLRRGGNALALQRTLGHVDLATTQRYCHLAVADLQAAHQQISLLAR